MRLFLLAGILGGAIPVLAQSAQPSPTPAPTPVFDDAIVVTAAAVDEPQSRTPATVTVVGSAEIAVRQATEVGDLLRDVPGIAIARSGSPGHATSLFTRGTESNQTLVLWNGVPLNEPFLGGYDWASLPTEGVDRVEVVRGPFSALYGSGALGGVVQVLTSSTDSTSAHLEGGERGYARAGLAAGHTFGDFHLALAAHLRRGQGELPNDRYDGEGVEGRGEWAFSPGATLGLLLRRSSADIGIPLDNGVPTPRERQGFDDRQVALPLHGTTGRFGYEALLSENRTDLRFRNPDDPYGFTSADTETRTRRSRASGTYELLAEPGGATARLTLGGEWSRDQASNRSSFGVAFLDESRRSTGGFTELQATTEHTSWEVGVRRDDDQFFGGHTSPRLGVAFVLGRGWRLRSSYGEAFRAPSFAELFYPGSGNLALRPEKSRAGELGIEWQGRAVGLRLTGFENRLRDLIDFDPVRFQSVNVGRARTRGVEGEAVLRRGDLTLRANATYLDAEDLDTGTQLLRRPHQSASLSLQWAPARATLAATLRAVGERRDYPDVRLPGYSALDLAATWHTSELLSPYLRVDNALDRRYQEVAGYPAPRRRFAGGVALRF